MTSSKQSGYKLVLIEWVDSSRISNEWVNLTDVPQAYLHKCVTVGFIVSENKNGKILVPTISDIEHPADSHTYGGMMIPQKAIVSEKLLALRNRK